MTSIRQAQHLIYQSGYAFFIYLKDAYFHNPIVSHHHFVCYVWQYKTYQWKVLPFGLATAPWVFTPLSNLYCSFAVTRVFMLLYI